jgi:hypothetical protein
LGVFSFGFCFTEIGMCQEPEKVTVCQVKTNPAEYNHQLIEVTGFVSHGFEDFTIFDPTCSSYPNIWLEYGGTAASGTMYCCGVTADRSRPQQIVVKGISVPLIQDDKFRNFDNLIQRPPDSLAHSVIRGRFFSGEREAGPKGVRWAGFGHFGCCSLLVIQQIVSVDPQERQDLDSRASADQPDIPKVGCWFRDLLPIESHSDSMTAQRNAESGELQWAFDDPERVASYTLAQLTRSPEKSIAGLKVKRTSQGRIVYEWSPRGRRNSYMIVVSRPYWLSFYSKDAHNKVAWVAIAGYESSCDKSNSVKKE